MAMGSGKTPNHKGRYTGSRGGIIRPEVLGDERLARELEELLVLTGIVEIPDETSSPRGLPSGRRNDPPEIDAALAARIERAVERLGSHIEVARQDLSGLETAHRKLSELLEER